jgi:hypothetical protein
LKFLKIRTDSHYQNHSNKHLNMNKPLSTHPNTGPALAMAGKPVLKRTAKTVLTLKARAFQEKQLCDGITLNLGDACVFRCTFCYVAPAMRKLLISILGSAKHTEVVIRRENALALLRKQLYHPDGRRKRCDPQDRRVVFGSTLVDVAANMELVRETTEACLQILQATNWQIRLLSKSPLLRKVAGSLIGLGTTWLAVYFYGNLLDI